MHIINTLISLSSRVACPPIGPRLKPVMIAHQRLRRGPEKGRRFQESNPNKLQKDPRTKHPGVFVFRKEKMIERDQRKIKEAEWLKEHTLTPEQLKQLFQNKLVRARQSYEATRKREDLCKAG